MQLHCPDIRVVTIVPRVTTCHHSLLLPLDAGCPRLGGSGLPVRAVNGTSRNYTVLGEPGTFSMLKALLILRILHNMNAESSTQSGFLVRRYRV